MGYTASLDQRTESSSTIVSTGVSGISNITFGKAFFTGLTGTDVAANAQLPSIGIVAQNMASGDYYNVTSVSDTGFTVAFKDSNNSAVNRSFYWTAVGYGRRA